MNTRQLAVNTLRILSAECIDRANSGHPGLPLGAAPIVYTLYADFLKFNPKNPKFDNRDRFVLSAGHGSALLYSTLHLFGYDLPVSELMNFRQENSKTPGHPEYGVTNGVEVSTGPLGQGIANAVGMAIAEKKLSAHFNREGFNVVDHYTYALCGDGCMQEGIEYEAASLAGTLKLSKLIVLYDKNDISIEGDISVAFTEDVGARHKAQGWNVLYVKDGNDLNEIRRAIKKAKSQNEKPSLIICKTKIGFGSPWEGTAKVHGTPLGTENLNKLKENLGWTEAPFTIPSKVKSHVKSIIKKGITENDNWNSTFAQYKERYPELAAEYALWTSGKVDLKDESAIASFDKPEATRNCGYTVLNRVADLVPNLFGGSADLGPSNKTIMKNREYFSNTNPDGSNVHFGIREHAMAAVCNGISVHGGLIPYCSTFFAFSDYMKNAIRLSALMNLKVIYILTHDSIGVGEDGPTHQPIEHLASLRTIPNLRVYRPADGKETAYAYIDALKSNGPSVIVLSRQTLPLYENSGKSALYGGYVISYGTKQTPDCLLIASGSEVECCVKAKDILKTKGIDARVVSMPSLNVFETQSPEYKESVIPSNVKARVCVEAGTSFGWHKYAGDYGEIISIDTFGESAPSDILFEKFGFTAENVCEKAQLSLAKLK